jgi:hypothetical protein
MKVNINVDIYSVYSIYYGYEPKKWIFFEQVKPIFNDFLFYRSEVQWRI